MKVIIFDSGALISLSMAGLLNEFRALRKSFDGKFIITPWVKQEIVDKPISRKRFELEALKIKDFLEDGILEMSSSLKISDKEIEGKANEYMEKANNTFFKRKDPIHIIDSGESSCLALSKILTEKKIVNVIAMDERTTRVLCEKPQNLRNLLQDKLHTRIEERSSNYSLFKGFNFIRSAELMYVAFKKKLTDISDPRVLDAMLYAVKFNGCAITDDEINEMKRMG